MADADAFTRLYDNYAPMVFAKCLRILVNRQDAEEAFQEVMVKVAAHVGRLEGMDNRLAWLYRVTTNTCLNLIRTRKRRTLPNWVDSDQVGQAGDQERVGDRRKLEAIFGRLNKKEQRFFVYYYIDEMTQDEIADVTGTARITVARALKRIRAVAGDRDEDSE